LVSGMEDLSIICRVVQLDKLSGETHVHKFSGAYVGELDHDMVVDKHLGNLGNIGNPGNPGIQALQANPGNRGSIDYGYQDVFSKLEIKVGAVLVLRGGLQTEVSRFGHNDPDLRTHYYSSSTVSFVSFRPDPRGSNSAYRQMSLKTLILIASTGYLTGVAANIQKALYIGAFLL